MDKGITRCLPSFYHALSYSPSLFSYYHYNCSKLFSLLNPFMFFGLSMYCTGCDHMKVKYSCSRWCWLLQEAGWEEKVTLHGYVLVTLLRWCQNCNIYHNRSYIVYTVCINLVEIEKKEGEMTHFFKFDMIYMLFIF